MTLSELVDKHGTVAEAARQAGMARTTFRERLEKERRVGTKPVEFVDLPDRLLPTEEIIAHKKRIWQRQKEYHEAATWRQIHIDEELPFGIALMGDVHIDDDSCNWDELTRDIEIMAETTGVYAINVGDYTNNWVGRLTELYGDQEASKETARQLTKWLLCESGITWAAIVTGNHDEWNEGNSIIQSIAGNSHVDIPVHNWSAKVEITCATKRTTRINASHDFKGRSWMSATHGPLKEAIVNQADGAHILAAGHIHYGGLQQVELAGGHNPWLVRVRGYKHHDKYALVKGFHEGIRFASMMAIIDPLAEQGNHVMVVPCLRQGAQILTAMRHMRQYA